MLVGVGVSPSIIYARPNPALALLSSAAVWPDVQDLSSMRVGRNGSGAAAVGQPVGFIADKGTNGTSGRSIEAALGGDLVANPLAGAMGAAWSLSGQSLIRNGTVGMAAITLTRALSLSEWCVVRFTVTQTGDTNAIRLGGSGTAHQFVGNGTFEFVIQPGGTGAHLSFLPWGGSAGTATIDNISVRELPGSHFVAPSDAARSVLRQDAVTGAYYLEPDGVDDWMSISPTVNLGDTWWHLGGWRATVIDKFAWSTSANSGSNAPYTGVNVGYPAWQWRNDGADGYLDISSGGAINVNHVLGIEQSIAGSNTYVAGRYNGGAPIVAAFTSTRPVTTGLALFSSSIASAHGSFAGRFYGGAWGTGGLPAADRAILERYFATLVGVTIP